MVATRWAHRSATRQTHIYSPCVRRSVSATSACGPQKEIWAGASDHSSSLSMYLSAQRGRRMQRVSAAAAYAQRENVLQPVTLAIEGDHLAHLLLHLFDWPAHVLTSSSPSGFRACALCHGVSAICVLLCMAVESCKREAIAQALNPPRRLCR
jgi:hypothetical protein